MDTVVVRPANLKATSVQCTTTLKCSSSRRVDYFRGVHDCNGCMFSSPSAFLFRFTSERETTQRAKSKRSREHEEETQSERGRRQQSERKWNREREGTEREELRRHRRRHPARRQRRTPLGPRDQEPKRAMGTWSSWTLASGRALPATMPLNGQSAAGRGDAACRCPSHAASLSLSSLVLS